MSLQYTINCKRNGADIPVFLWNKASTSPIRGGDFATFKDAKDIEMLSINGTCSTLVVNKMGKHEAVSHKTARAS